MFRLFFFFLVIIFLLVFLKASQFSYRVPSIFYDSFLEQDFSLIQSGCFLMGSSAYEKGRDYADETRHKVCLEQDFYLATTEVTVGQFKKFIKATGYITQAEKKGSWGCWSDTEKNGRWQRNTNISWQNPGFKQTDNHPVVCISLYDAMVFIDWLNKTTGKNYRLPTEVEWEYAIRANAYKPNPWWTQKDACQFANIVDQATVKPWYTRNKPFFPCHDGYLFTAPVGQFQANASGLHDMLGNAWEWNCSIYDYQYQNFESVCAGLDSEKSFAMRGGSFASIVNDLRFASRQGAQPHARSAGLGIRLVKAD